MFYNEYQLSVIIYVVKIVPNAIIIKRKEKSNDYDLETVSRYYYVNYGRLKKSKFLVDVGCSTKITLS